MAESGRRADSNITEFRKSLNVLALSKNNAISHAAIQIAERATQEEEVTYDMEQAFSALLTLDMTLKRLGRTHDQNLERRDSYGNALGGRDIVHYSA